jgi:hypothetical protein
MRERNPFESFLPRSSSATVFTLSLACYDWALTALFGAVVRLFHFSPRPIEFWETHGDPMAVAIATLLFAPIVESAILIGIIELLGWMRMSMVVQVFLAGLLVAVAHSFSWAWTPYAFVVLPSFVIQSGAYLYCRRISRKQGFAVVVSIHALHNLIPMMYTIAYATRGT